MSTYLNCNRKINSFFLAECRPNLMPFFMEAGSGSVKYFLASMKCYSNQNFYYCTSSAFFSARLHLIFKFSRQNRNLILILLSHIITKKPVCWYNYIFNILRLSCHFSRAKKVRVFSTHTFEQVNLKNKEKKIFQPFVSSRAAAA